MTNLIPMAGEGKRFKDVGYTTPKPFIPVSGKPMIIQAARSMPASDKWIFVCRKEHVDDYKISEVLRKEFTNAQIITVDKTTEGQAATCLLAKNLMDKDKPLFIGCCDAGMIWNRKKWGNLIGDKSIDAVIWAFTKQPNLVVNPKAWGWIDVDSNNVVKRMSVKIPISGNPFNDQAVIGNFWFRTGQLFIDMAEELIRKNIRVNNEFYVDSIPDVLIKHGKKVVTFVVDKYIGWGTPVDLQTYEYWEDYFNKNPEHPYKKSLDPDYS